MSALEATIAESIRAAGGSFAYEAHKFPYVVPATHRTYLLDFGLPNGIALEGKGYLLRADRMKLLRVREEHPQLDLRLIVGRVTAQCEGLRLSIGEWCDKFSFQWAVKHVPEEWILERPRKARLEALERFRRWTTTPWTKA